MYFLVQAPQPAPQLLSHLRVECAEGFVEQQHVGLDRQRARQRDALPLSPGKLRRVAIGKCLELHQLQQLSHAPRDLGVPGAHAPGTHPKAERDVLEDAHVAEERVVLEDEPHVSFAHALGRGVAIGDAYGSRVWRFQSRDHAEERRLARSRRTEQRNKLAAFDPEAHVGHGGMAAVPLAHGLDLDAHDAASSLMPVFHSMALFTASCPICSHSAGAAS
jgi:hypothetical protein